MPAYDYAEFYRAKKVTALALTLKEHGWDAAAVRKMTDEDWGRVSVLAGVKPPSGQETKDAVIEALEAAERSAVQSC